MHNFVYSLGKKNVLWTTISLNKLSFPIQRKATRKFIYEFYVLTPTLHMSIKRKSILQGRILWKRTLYNQYRV